MQEAGAIPLGFGLLRDEFFRKGIVELGGTRQIKPTLKPSSRASMEMVAAVAWLLTEVHRSKVPPRLRFDSDVLVCVLAASFHLRDNYPSGGVIHDINDPPVADTHPEHLRVKFRVPVGAGIRPQFYDFLVESRVFRLRKLVQDLAGWFVVEDLVAGASVLGGAVRCSHCTG